jgi:hypothetical protein
MTGLDHIAEQGADEFCKKFVNSLTDTDTIALVKIAYKYGFMVGGRETLRQTYKDKSELKEILKEVLP